MDYRIYLAASNYFSKIDQFALLYSAIILDHGDIQYNFFPCQI